MFQKLDKFLDKRLLVLTIIVIQIVFVIFIILISPNMFSPVRNRNEYQFFWQDRVLYDGDIHCHYLNSNDILPPAEDKNFKPKENSIFFHETSCRGALTSRQACAIEAAARIHPGRDIYVLFSSPVDEFTFKESVISKLKVLSNINYARVHIKEYANNTPLELLVESNRIDKANFKVQLSSDILRFLTLYKWGGIYLDMDMIVAHNLDALGKNWAALEDTQLVNGAVLAIGKDKIGRNVIKAVMQEINNSYDPQIFNYNGPGAITRVLERWCNSSELETWNASKCGGFSVYDPEHFFPIDFEDYKKYFEPGEVKDVVKDVTKVYTYHLWNKLSSNTTVDKNSPYAKLAKKYCPEIYKMYSDKFGQ
ncbi:hypothetical protein K1T71_007459 [Dendrolimus kikuchii]|uniref:Uncharacterized protein n=1 Tax=Dendrolimus kikuchii TaxID=765133 RepID=A0ACC1D0P1_9NEOP|nr:hypothetical protein K1T71_007459 [Dendrolimus kikuchii]